jgi:predicted methyltransferase
MKTPVIVRHLNLASTLALALSAAACGPRAQTAQAPASSAAPAPAPAPSVQPAPAAAAPTPEEKKKAEEAAKLAEDRTKMREAAQVELARWTPELRAEASKLATTVYPSLRAGLSAALKSNVRKPGNAARDAARHPLATFEFAGIKPTSTVLEISPGEGWCTELLAPVLASKGQLLVTSTDPKGPPEARPTYYAERLQLFLDKSPELFGKVQRVIHTVENPDLGLDAKVDVVLAFRTMHGWHNSKSMSVWLGEVHQALKPGGVFAIEEHRAKADANPDESAKLGYLPEAFVIAQVEAAGFKLLAKSEVNANPKDTKDYADGVWTLPPTLKLGDKDRQKYVDIGESDRMTLKFQKVAQKAAPKVAAPAAPAAAAPAAATAPVAAAPKAATPAPATPAAPAAAAAPKK